MFPHLKYDASFFYPECISYVSLNAIFFGLRLFYIFGCFVFKMMILVFKMIDATNVPNV